jgi:hypothetical protein
MAAADHDSRVAVTVLTGLLGFRQDGPAEPDSHKPEGAENEATEQVAIADRIILDTTDLSPTWATSTTRASPRSASNCPARSTTPRS